MKFIQLCSILFLLVSCSSDRVKKQDYKTVKDFFPEEKAQVLVVGTFHFDYPGLDAHQIEEKNKVDVLKEPKKSEVTELVEYIKFPDFPIQSILYISCWLFCSIALLFMQNLNLYLLLTDSFRCMSILFETCLLLHLNVCMNLLSPF